MKQNLLLLLAFITLLFSFLIFHDKGNEIIKPHVEEYLESKLKNAETIELKTFKIGFTNSHIVALINNQVTIELQGELSLLMKSFNVNYHLMAPKGYENIKEAIDINGTIIGNIENETIHFKGNAEDKLGNIDFEDATYHLKNHHLTTDYLLTIDELAKLKPYVKQRLKGNMIIKGKIIKKQNIVVTGRSKNLEGVLDFILEENLLVINMNDISAQKLMQMLVYPQVFKSKVTGNIKYDLKERKGSINSQLKEAQLLPNDLTKLIKKFNGVDLAKERFNESKFNAKIAQEHIAFEFHAKSKTTTIILSDAHLNTKGNTIKANYNVAIENKDVGGKIKGDINNPKISVDSSKYIQRELNSVIDKNSDTLKKIGIGKKEQDKVKSFLHNMFK